MNGPKDVKEVRTACLSVLTTAGHASALSLKSVEPQQVMGRAHRTISAWKTGSESKGSGASLGGLAENRNFGRGMLSRVPPGWWGRGGERVLVLMLEERRKLREKG